MADCARTCRETLTYCLGQGGDHLAADHLRGMIDCADVCTWTAILHERQSPLAAKAMQLCAEACKSCQQSCETFGEDETMKACADACRQCYEHCVSN